MIGTPTPLYMTLEESADAEVYVKGTDIENIYADKQNDDWGVTVVFNSDGKDKFYEMTKKAADTVNGGTQKIYIYFR